MNNTYARAGGGSAVIKGVSKVVVAVEDQQQAKQFWTTRMGFSVTQDEAYGDERWVEVAPPDGGPVLGAHPPARGPAAARGAGDAAAFTGLLHL